MYLKFFKPLIDFILAFIALIIFSPLLLFTFLLLLISHKEIPIFKQKRPGKNEKIFTLYKFKTMNDKKDKSGKLLPDNMRLTKYGKFVRSYSLDELPQVINVLIGDMSIIGPRPLLPKYLPLYTEEQKKRHDVKPGITGLAQIKGRNAISWEKKFKFDVEYVRKVSFMLDLHIFLKTFIKIFKREGVNASSKTTMKPFN